MRAFIERWEWMPESETYEIHIIPAHGEEFPCMAAPGETEATDGDRIDFFNETGQAVTVEFPDTTLFGIDEITLQVHGQESLTVKDVGYSSHTCTVYCTATKLDGEKSSRPIIIIYPRQA